MAGWRSVALVVTVCGLSLPPTLAGDGQVRSFATRAIFSALTGLHSRLVSAQACPPAGLPDRLGGRQSAQSHAVYFQVPQDKCPVEKIPELHLCAGTSFCLASGACLLCSSDNPFFLCSYVPEPKDLPSNISSSCSKAVTTPAKTPVALQLQHFREEDDWKNSLALPFLSQETR